MWLCCRGVLFAMNAGCVSVVSSGWRGLLPKRLSFLPSVSFYLYPRTDDRRWIGQRLSFVQYNTKIQNQTATTCFHSTSSKTVLQSTTTPSSVLCTSFGTISFLQSCPASHLTFKSLLVESFPSSFSPTQKHKHNENFGQTTKQYKH
jgi:hypothetical protein